MSDERRAEIVGAYLGGATAVALAEEYGRSPRAAGATLTEIARQLGVAESKVSLLVLGSERPDAWRWLLVHASEQLVEHSEISSALPPQPASAVRFQLAHPDDEEPKTMRRNERTTTLAIDSRWRREHVDGHDALARIRAARSRIRAFEEELDEAVAQARASRLSWEAIGAAPGMARQSAHSRWATHRTPAATLVSEPHVTGREMGPTTTDTPVNAEDGYQRCWRCNREAAFALAASFMFRLAAIVLGGGAGSLMCGPIDVAAAA